MSSAMGRNLTYGMLDMLGKAIVTGQYDNQIFPTEAELAKNMTSVAQSFAKRSRCSVPRAC